VRALAEETVGPFRTSGPLGMQLQRHASTFYTTDSRAFSGAKSILDRSIRERSVRVPFTAAWNPALDVLDTVRIAHDPTLPPVLGMIVRLDVDVINASMSGECVVHRGSL